MIPKDAIIIIAVILFIMPIVIFVPTIMSNTTAENQTETTMLYENETHNYDQYIEVTVNEVAPSSAEISIIDTNSGESETAIINESEQHTYEFTEGNISITLEDIHTDERIVIITEYPTEFSYDNDESQVNGFMPYVIVIPMTIVMLVVLLAAIGGE